MDICRNLIMIICSCVFWKKTFFRHQKHQQKFLPLVGGFVLAMSWRTKKMIANIGTAETEDKLSVQPMTVAQSGNV